MSDEPLFRSTDEQERAYAPQQMPEGDPAERRVTEAHPEDRDDVPPTTVAPGMGAGFLSGGQGSGAAGVPGGASVDTERTDDTESRDDTG